MKFRTLGALLLLAVGLDPASAQTLTTTFELPQITSKVAQSNYSKIRFLDARPDTTALGMVLKGSFNKPTRLVAAPSLQVQLSRMLAELNPPDAQAGELLFHLRQCVVWEVTGFSETGTADLYADLYAVKGDSLYRLDRLDTTVAIRNAMSDVTTRLLDYTSDAMVDFISANLSKAPETASFVLSEQAFGRLDSVEKAQLPLYTLDTLRDGVYETYTSFAQQLPDAGVNGQWRGNQLTRVKRVDSKTGKAALLRGPYTYAVVVDGKPFIVTRTGLSRLIKKGDQYVYKGTVASSPNTLAIAVSSAAFGLIGGLIASAATQDNQLYEIAISHFNGVPVVLRKIFMDEDL